MVRMIEKLRRFRITVVESQAQKSYSKTVIGPITVLVSQTYYDGLCLTDLKCYTF